ncbi:MAG: hypothetical protein KIT84_23370 [Labilithrix sp.]|nr:hypothetical protein [Labilithrix sp.]MCW5813988.1 hypothetical protein [Labilithrix sp.]
MLKRGLPLLLVGLSVLAACGDKPDAKTPVTTASPALDDALALLPANAIMVGTVDARAFFGSETFGADLSKLIETYMPLGAEAGFTASKDVDRITFASYAYQGVDAAAVVVGRFDEAKIKQAVTAQTQTKGGGYLVASQYAGRDVYTLNNIGFTILSPTRVVAGTESGIRRVLERIKDNRVKRDIPQWMLETVESPGAAAAVAADFATQPIPPDVVQKYPVQFVKDMKGLRGLVSFKSPGMQIAGSLTYPDAASATANAEHVKSATSYLKLLSLVGVQVKGLDVKAEQSDVQVKLEIDDLTLRGVLAAVPQWIGPPPRSSAPPPAPAPAPAPAPPSK